MVEEGTLKKVRKVKLIPENNRRLRYLSKEECEALVEQCNDHTKTIVQTALNTGMRKGELLSLTWDNVDMKRIHLLDKTKNGERREIPINGTLRAVFQSLVRRLDVTYLFFDPATGKPYQDVKRSFNRACRRAGIRDFHFHDLRHTFASHLVMAGIDITTVKELLGHKCSRYEPAETYGVFTAEAGFCLELRSFGLRRSGNMSARQKQIRAERDARSGRPDPRARRRVHAAALQRLAALVPPEQTLELRSDEETDLLPAIRALAATRPVRHVTVSSRARRDSRNPLWMINHKHKLQRHCLASHRRQTIAAHKTLAGLQDCQLLSRCWMNLTKGVSERTGADRRTTPAMRLGIAARSRSGRRLFGRRRFPKRDGLPDDLRALYEGARRHRYASAPTPMARSPTMRG